ncbi:MAG: D-tyrosyl-tRNA(Tyr) deacylase [Desulfobacterales bacterium]|nr:D-tyrosyl-tRNA(Tyr) deacylase [Desulfobacterales bacterium]MBF0397712.1 D-tyrosyl-tRNA(Tyr) deacylase [Desulfobacterales bacterium]
MIAVIQRVINSSVVVDKTVINEIKSGMLILLGVAKDDTADDVKYLTEKIINLRIFEDENGKMNRSLLEIKGDLLVVSQFTLLGDCRKGRRPSFTDAAPPEKANELYELFIEVIKKSGIFVKTGKFGAMMEVHLINDGPVTFILQT